MRVKARFVVWAMTRLKQPRRDGTTAVRHAYLAWKNAEGYAFLHNAAKRDGHEFVALCGVVADGHPALGFYFFNHKRCLDCTAIVTAAAEGLDR